MNRHKILYVLITGMLCPALLHAQSSYEYNSDNASIYSRFGLGTLAHRANGFNTSMAGAGLALMAGNRINSSNPASYSRVDSLTFILDVGMSLDNNTISYNGSTSGSTTSRLSHVNMAFQLFRNVGISIGYMPITSIGYDYVSSTHVGWNSNTNQEVRSSSTYFGTGGMHQMYIGIGYSPFKNLSVGLNAGYIWGEYNHAMTQTFTEGGASSTGYNSQTTLYQAYLSSYSIDFGLQYAIHLNKKDVLSLGATVGLGHNMNNEADFYRYTSADTMHVQLGNAFDIPMTYGVGMAYQKDNKWTVAADVTMECWADCKSPFLNDKRQYVSEKGQYMNRMTYRIGGEFCPNALSRNYIQRMVYRVGAYYNTPYVKINGQNGPKEYGITAGFALPITNSFNNRSVVNIGFRWNHVEQSVAGMIKENQLCVTLGLTFNEQWFLKWKIR